MDGKAPKRIYFSIGEVSDMTDVPQHVLRYWEEVFPSLNPPKRRSGSRAYREQDIEKVRLIKQLLYEQGFTIRGARKKLRKEILEEEETRKLEALSDKLSDIEERIQNILDILDLEP
ncbi:MAG: MerR family transcriptional regulator [Candidatus Abyssobacteria bacterium SURF_17]|jgi:DNA-binding transcriptional MerR regulator|uniref:MerR family transcriptional regulator n=1 Tax=Candidatus Abyssobacteria bacterium SURF_17 TaxID=2093361 RepID=A0A419F8Z8_9BACT|nr:MAG: MerR family transcriptional regulator [Candidatus Abyssubacteria bacterium SURF_17]